jgi:hypothetical protein
MIKFIVPNLGQCLIVNDEVKESDVIVVLMGSVYDRILEAVLEAVDLYHEGYSDKIVLINRVILLPRILLLIEE